MPSEQNTFLGGNILNLINSFFFFFKCVFFVLIFFKYSSIWLCNGRFSMKTQRNQNLGAIFSLLWCYVFFLVFVVWVKGNLAVRMSRHQQPPWLSLTTTSDAGGPLLHPFFVLFSFVLFSGGVCMPFLYISTHRSVQHGGVCYLLLRRTSTDKEKLVPNVGEEAKMVLPVGFACHLLLKTLRCGSGRRIICATATADRSWDVDTLWLGPKEKGWGPKCLLSVWNPSTKGLLLYV